MPMTRIFLERVLQGVRSFMNSATGSGTRAISLRFLQSAMPRRSLLAFAVLASNLQAQILVGGAFSPVADPALLPALRGPVRVVGTRLRNAGMERTTLTGSLVVAGVAPQPVTVIYQLPFQVRVVEGSVVYGFDGVNAWAANGTLSQTELSILSVVLFDLPEGFLLSESVRFPGRQLGSRCRTDGGNDSNYPGPFYDLFGMRFSSARIPSFLQSDRIYWVNSQTHFLERVDHDLRSFGSEDLVSTVFGPSSILSGSELYPSSIAYSVNGRQVFQLQVSAAATAPSANDGSFAKP